MAKPYHVSMAQHHAIQFAEQRMSALSNWCSQIFDFGETAWREYLIPRSKLSSQFTVDATLNYRTFPPFLICSTTYLWVAPSTLSPLLQARAQK